MMSPEDWCKTHRLRPNGHRKLGPLPKKKPNIFDITAGVKGTAEKKYEPDDYSGFAAVRTLATYLCYFHRRPHFGKHTGGLLVASLLQVEATPTS